MQCSLVELAGDDRDLVTEIHRQSREGREGGFVDPACDPDFIGGHISHEGAGAASQGKAKLVLVSRSGSARHIRLTSVMVILLSCAAITPPRAIGRLGCHSDPANRYPRPRHPCRVTMAVRRSGRWPAASAGAPLRSVQADAPAARLRDDGWREASGRWRPDGS